MIWSWTFIFQLCYEAACEPACVEAICDDKLSLLQTRVDLVPGSSATKRATTGASEWLDQTLERLSHLAVEASRANKDTEAEATRTARQSHASAFNRRTKQQKSKQTKQNSTTDRSVMRALSDEHHVEAEQDAQEKHRIQTRVESPAQTLVQDSQEAVVLQDASRVNEKVRKHLLHTSDRLTQKHQEVRTSRADHTTSSKKLSRNSADFEELSRKSADSDPLCRSERALNFAKAGIGSSNLGGKGPDTDYPWLAFTGITEVEGRQVDLRVIANSSYEPNDNLKNGKQGPFGVINLQVDTKVDLLFQFVDNITGQPTVLEPFYFTFFDFDQGMAHGSRETVAISGFEKYKLSAHTELHVEEPQERFGIFSSTQRGGKTDNPAFPNDLNGLQRDRSVTVQFPATSEFWVTLEDSNFQDEQGRNFFFAGTSQLVCDKQAACTQFRCPEGFQQRTMAEFLECTDSPCPETDRDLCCFPLLAAEAVASISDQSAESEQRVQADLDTQQAQAHQQAENEQMTAQKAALEREKHAAIAQKEVKLAEKEAERAVAEQMAEQKEALEHEKHVAIAEKEVKLAKKEAEWAVSIAENEQMASQKEALGLEKHVAIAQKQVALAEKELDRAVAEQMAAQKEVLEREKHAAIAHKEVKLAEKEAEWVVEAEAEAKAEAVPRS